MRFRRGVDDREQAEDSTKAARSEQLQLLRGGVSCLSSHAAVALLKPTGTSCTEALGIIGGDNKCEHKRVAQQQIERTLSAQWVVASKSELDQQNSDIDGKI